MITQKITSIIKDCTRIVNQINTFLKSFEKLLRGIFYSLTLIYIAKGTFQQGVVNKTKIAMQEKIIETTNQIVTDSVVDAAPPPIESLNQTYYAYVYFHAENAYDYVFFGLGVVLMFVLLFKIIGLFKKQPPQ
jgi:uncharacterized protein YllA (UPF0747 family)